MLDAQSQMCDQEESRRRGQTALEVVKRCSSNAQLWNYFAHHPEVRKWLEKLMVEEVRREEGHGAFSQILTTISAELAELERSSNVSLPEQLHHLAHLKQEAPESAWPPRVKKRLRFKQGPQSIWMRRGVGALSMNLMAKVLCSVDLSTKLSAICVSRGFWEVLQCGSAWDPLVITQSECRRLLKSHRATRSLPEWGFPPAFYEVSVMDVDLMSPEEDPSGQSDTEDEEQQRMQRIRAPVGTFVNLFGSWTKVSKLTVRNIDSFSYTLLLSRIRCTCLESFGFVRIQYTGSSTYSLEAARREPLLVDPTLVAAMNAARMPHTVQVQSTTISEREALFLLEHETAYKNGSDIHFMYTNDTRRSHAIRVEYKSLVDSLKVRFPSSFR